MGETRDKTLSQRVGIAAAWNILKLVLNRGGSAIIMLGLAAYIGPEAFGLFAVVAVFNDIAQQLVVAGMNEAVIRESKVTPEGLDSVFWFNMVAAIVIYGVVALAAPLVSELYGNPQLTSLLRVACVVFILSAFRVVPVAILSRRLAFGPQTAAQTVAMIISGVLAVTAAYLGWGIWSLVVLVVSKATVGAIMITYYSGWFPSFRFSWKAFQPYWRFGRYLVLSNLAGRVSKNTYVVVLGSIFSTQIAGYYYFAQKIESLIGQQLSGAINQAGYPALTRFKDDNSALRERICRLLSMQLFFIAPAALVGGGLAAIAVPLIMGPDWNGAVVYVQLLAVIASIYPINVLNIKAMSVKGRSDYMLWVGLAKAGLQFLLLFVTAPFGALAIVVGQVAFGFVAWLLHSWINQSLIEYGLLRQVQDVWRILLSAACVAAAVLLAITYFPFDYSLTGLIVLSAASGIVYLALCLLLQDNTAKWFVYKSAEQFNALVTN